MGEYLASLHPRFAEIRRNPAKRRRLESAFANATDAFQQEIHRDTLNDRLYTRQADLFLDEARFYAAPQYVGRAIDALNEAIELSPHRIQPRLLLAKVYID